MRRRRLQSPRAGRLNTEAAERHGVPRGPLFAQLKEGHDVVFPDGRAVQSAAVVSPPQRLGISSAPLADERKHRAPKGSLRIQYRRYQSGQSFPFFPFDRRSNFSFKCRRKLLPFPKGTTN